MSVETKINIYGERNSGTNFLYNLLKNNINCEISYIQKHGIVNNNNNNNLKVCIIRDLNNWLNSMYKNPYHLIKNNNIYNYINNKTITNKKDTCKYNINLNDKYNLLELRYLKYKSYINSKNTILVKLDYLQESNENIKNFLNYLENEYNLIRKELKIINKYYGGQGEKYTKNKKITKKYNILDKKKMKNYDKEIEGKINNLKFIKF